MSKPYIPLDTWAKRAKAEGYRARSVYKLMELDDRFGLIRPGMNVLDLGAAPGSWLQYVMKRLQGQGTVVGIDRVPIPPLGAVNVKTFERDLQDLPGVEADLKHLSIAAFDLLLSDAAPDTSGVAQVDQWRSIELCRTVLAIADRWLKPGGVCVLKIFRGEDFDAFLTEVRSHFARVQQYSPSASRDRSREVYLVGWQE